MVLTGDGAGVSPIESLVDGNAEFSWQWQLEIPAGETRAVLTYVVAMGPDESAADVAALAAAIADGSRADMFIELDASVRSQIINFVVPAP